jgi:hypothetical protein
MVGMGRAVILGETGEVLATMQAAAKCCWSQAMASAMRLEATSVTADFKQPGTGRTGEQAVENFLTEKGLQGLRVLGVSRRRRRRTTASMVRRSNVLAGGGYGSGGTAGGGESECAAAATR